ncbi:MBL fold metallo-hydrolase [Arthrobacter sp. HLT1-20]
MTASWQQLGSGIYLMPSSPERALVNIGLVVGTDRALLIDTGCGPRHAREILLAVRTLTGLPLLVAVTHAHWDHFFGNAVFMRDGATEFWAHANAARSIAGTGEAQRAAVAATEPEMAAGKGPDTEMVVPTHLVCHAPVTLDLGGISVDLFTLGRGHTDGDLMVGARSVLFTGDVVEEGAQPQYEDAFVREWVHVLRKLADMGHRYPIMVPGHGRPVTAGFAAWMAGRLEADAPPN